MLRLSLFLLAPPSRSDALCCSLSTSSLFPPLFSLKRSCSHPEFDNNNNHNNNNHKTALHRPLGRLLVPPLARDRRRAPQDPAALGRHARRLGPARDPLGRRALRARLAAAPGPVPAGLFLLQERLQAPRRRRLCQPGPRGLCRGGLPAAAAGRRRRRGDREGRRRRAGRRAGPAPGQGGLRPAGVPGHDAGRGPGGGERREGGFWSSPSPSPSPSPKQEGKNSNL